MPRRCSVYYCKSNYVGQTGGYISTFSLPKDKLLRKIWIKNTRTDLSHIKRPLVCVKHFRKEDVIWEDKCIVRGEVKYFRRKIPKLRKGAVPKIFDFLSSGKKDGIKVQKIGGNISEENIDETDSHQNVISKESPSHGRSTDLAELKNKYSDSDESSIPDQLKFPNENMGGESSESPDEVRKCRTESIESLEDYTDESSSEIPSYWSNNITKTQVNEDIEMKKNDVQNNELLKKFVQMNSEVTKHLEKSNNIKYNMLQEMKLSNKLELAKLKIKCKIYDLDLDIINNAD